MAIYTMPLTATIEYSFSTALDQIMFDFHVHWNETTSAWYIDLESQDGLISMKNIKLITGLGLIRQHGHRELGELVVLDGEYRAQDPNFDDMGSRWQLYYLDTAEYA